MTIAVMIMKTKYEVCQRLFCFGDYYLGHSNGRVGCVTRAGTCRDLTKAGSFHYTIVLLVSLAKSIHQPCFGLNKPNRQGCVLTPIQRCHILVEPRSSKSIQGHWELLRNMKLIKKDSHKLSPMDLNCNVITFQGIATFL